MSGEAKPRKYWHAEEIPLHSLMMRLNQIEIVGGVVFSVTDGNSTRKDHACLVWFEPAKGA